MVELLFNYLPPFLTSFLLFLVVEHFRIPTSAIVFFAADCS